MAKKIVYSEPADYFPKEIRKQAGIGEYAKTEKKSDKQSTKKSTKK